MLADYSKTVARNLKDTGENAYIKKMRLHCEKYINAAEAWRRKPTRWRSITRCEPMRWKASKHLDVGADFFSPRQSSSRKGAATMPITYKQEEENQPGSNDLASDLEQAGIDVEAESYPTEKEKPGGGINQSPKKRRMFRWVVLLMVIGLAGAGYVYRERLLRLVSKDAAQSTQTAERKVLYWVDLCTQPTSPTSQVKRRTAAWI